MILFKDKKKFIEILVWFLVLVILFLYLKSCNNTMKEQGMRTVTKSVIFSLVRAFDQYKKEKGYYPKSDISIRKIDGVLTVLNGNGLENENIKDSWGTPLKVDYRDISLRITSAGPNKKFGDDDDISNKE